MTEAKKFEHRHSTRSPFYLVWAGGAVVLMVVVAPIVFPTQGILATVACLLIYCLMFLAVINALYRFVNPVVYQSLITESEIQWQNSKGAQHVYRGHDISEVAIDDRGEWETLTLRLNDEREVKVESPLAYFGDLQKLGISLAELGYDVSVLD